MKSNSKPGSLLKIKHFSESEEDDDQSGNEDDVEMENQSENEENSDKNSDAVNEINNDDDDEELYDVGKEEKKKPGKKGIIYVGSIPKHMNVAICREFMECFGEVNRIFLQPDKKGSK
jgi:ESF2/ABP1 family protein